MSLNGQVVATRRVRGGAKLRPAATAPNAAGGADVEDAPEAAFDPDALLPRTDIGPQLNEVRLPYSLCTVLTLLWLIGELTVLLKCLAASQALPPACIGSY